MLAPTARGVRDASHVDAYILSEQGTPATDVSGFVNPQASNSVAATCSAHGFTMSTANVYEFAQIPGLVVEVWA